MDDKIALYWDEWDISNMAKDLFGIDIDILFSEL